MTENSGDRLFQPIALKQLAPWNDDDDDDNDDDKVRLAPTSVS